MKFKRKRVAVLALTSLLLGTGTIAYAGSAMFPNVEKQDMLVDEAGVTKNIAFYEVYNPNQVSFYYGDIKYDKKDIVVKRNDITPGYGVKGLQKGQTVDAKLKEISVSINKKEPVKMKAYTVGDKTFVRPAEFYKAVGANAYYVRPDTESKDGKYVTHPCLGYGGIRLSVKPYYEPDLLGIKQDLKADTKVTLDTYGIEQNVGLITTLGFVEDRDIFFEIGQLVKVTNDLNVQIHANRTAFNETKTLLVLKMKDLGSDGVYHVISETVNVEPIRG